MSSKSGKRTFTVAGSSVNAEGGHYKTSGTPGAAAKKAAKILFRMVENKEHQSEWKKYEQFKEHKTIKFILRETTHGSPKKSYYYEAKVQHLKEADHIKVMINGKEVVYTKKIVVKTCNDPLNKVGSVAKSTK